MPDTSGLQLTLSAILSILSLIITNLVLAFQIRLLRKQLHIDAQTSLTEKWNNVSDYEIKHPNFHKMLMNKNQQIMTKDLSEDQLRERAFAHLVFDVCYEQYQVSANHKTKVGVDTYLSEILQNDKLRSYWKDYGLREAWNDSPFQKIVDTLACEAELLLAKQGFY